MTRRITITIEVSDEHDPTLTDPHDIAAEVMDAWHGERASGNTAYELGHWAAEWEPSS